MSIESTNLSTQEQQAFPTQDLGELTAEQKKQIVQLARKILEQKPEERSECDVEALQSRVEQLELEAEVSQTRGQFFTMLQSMSSSVESANAIVEEMSRLPDQELLKAFELCSFLEKQDEQLTAQKMKDLVFGLKKNSFFTEKVAFFLKVAPSMCEQEPLALLQHLSTLYEFDADEQAIYQHVNTIKEDWQKRIFYLNVLKIKQADKKAPLFAETCKKMKEQKEVLGFVHAFNTFDEDGLNERLKLFAELPDLEAQEQGECIQRIASMSIETVRELYQGLERKKHQNLCVQLDFVRFLSLPSPKPAKESND